MTESPSPATVTAGDYIIRPAEESDAESLSKLLTYVWPLTYSQWIPMNIIEEHVLPNHTVEKVRASLKNDDDWFVALSNSPSPSPHQQDEYPIIGLAKIRPDPLPSTPHLPYPMRNPSYLALLYLHPSAQGKGLAQSLLQYTEKAAIRKGHDGLWFTVFGLNSRAARFYEKSGYEKFGEKKEEERISRTELYYAKSLI